MQLPTHLILRLSKSEKQQEESVFFPQLIQQLLQWDAREIVVSLLLRYLNKNPDQPWAWEALGDAFVDWEPNCSEAAYAIAFLNENEKEAWKPIISDLLQSSWSEIPLLEICDRHYGHLGSGQFVIPSPLQVLYLN